MKAALKCVLAMMFLMTVACRAEEKPADVKLEPGLPADASTPPVD